MADEAPAGHSQDPGADTDGQADPWWPWPETQADEPTGPRDGAPEGDQTRSLPVEDQAAALPAEHAADTPTPAVVTPEPEVVPAPAPAPGPAPEVPELEPAPEVPEPEAPEPASVVDVTRPAQTVSVQASPAVVAGATSALAPGSESSWVPVAAVDQRTNEAIPAVPPEAGTGPIGSIPAAHARAVWSRLQASNWRLFLIRFLSAGLAVVLTVAIVPGLGFTGWRWGDFTRIAVIFGLLNATVKPLLQFLVLRFIFSTYGIVVVVINTLLLVLLAAILEGTFEATRPLSVVFGGLVVGVLGLILETLLGATPPTLDRDYKERNALS